MRFIVVLTVLVMLTPGVRGQDGDEVRRLKAKVELLEAKLKLAEKEIDLLKKELELAKGGRPPAGPKPADKPTFDTVTKQLKEVQVKIAGLEARRESKMERKKELLKLIDEELKRKDSEGRSTGTGTAVLRAESFQITGELADIADKLRELKEQKAKLEQTRAELEAAGKQ